MVPVFLSSTWVHMDVFNGKKDLCNAELKEADLERANLSHADLRKADFSNAELSKTIFNHADLRGAIITKKQLKSCASCEGAKLDPKLLE